MNPNQNQNQNQIQISIWQPKPTISGTMTGLKLQPQTQGFYRFDHGELGKNVS